MRTFYYRWSKDFLEAGKKRLSGDTVREATTDEVKDLRAEKAALKETLAELFMENPVLKKKRARGWRGRYMRYSASEKYEIIQLVQHSDLSVKRTLARLDIHKSTFYNWLSRYHDGSIDALEDKKPQLSLPWNKVPADHREALIDFALRETDLSLRELAVRCTD